MRLELLLLLWGAFAITIWSAETIVSAPSRHLAIALETEKFANSKSRIQDTGVKTTEIDAAVPTRTESKSTSRRLFAVLPSAPEPIEELELRPVTAIVEVQPEFRLFGLVQRDDEYLALVEANGGDQFQLVGGGQEVGSYNVISVFIDRVLIEDVLSKEQRYIDLRGEGELP